MSNTKHIHHHHRHIGFSYPASLWQRIYSIVLAPLLFIVAVFFLLKLFSDFQFAPQQISPSFMGLALLETLSRLLIAYIGAIIVAIPLAMLINQSALAERILLPVFDILQSIPVLAFFPVIILFFVHFNFINGAAVFVIFLSMLWNIVFSIVGGMKVIPNDIKYAAQIFNIRGFDFLRRVVLPAIVPYLVTGSLLAWAQGWNIIIVAEVLHTYLPGGNTSQDLFGIGSLLVNAVASGQNAIFVAAMFTMIAAIAFINFFIWQKLLHYAERFKFE